MMSDSTYKFVESTLARQGRGRLLRRRTALYCSAHQRVERVIDRFPNGECKLGCGFRRMVSDIAAVGRFEIEQQKRNEESAV
jgi:hypothetical protein